MSEVNLQFTVNSFSTTITANAFPIAINPSATQLTLYTGGAAQAAGTTGQLQYNNGGQLAGINNVTSDGNSLSLTNVANLKVGGGSANTFLKTDGAGNLSFASVITAPGGSNTQLQFNNNGAFAGMANVTYDGSKLTLGNASYVKITGGTNGQYLQTDGTGNIAWVSGGGSGNGAVGGSNTQVQFNDAGVFGGSANFTFDNAINLLTATNIAGNGSGLTSITGANVTGTVPSAGTVTTGAQPNITSTGTLTSLSVGGTTSIQQATEKVTANATGSTGTINYDLLTQAILYKTANATSDFTLNFRGSSSTSLNTMLANNQSITCTFLNTNGSTGFYPSAYTIDGITVTPKWTGTAPGAGTANKTDVFTYNIIKLGTNTYAVFASAGAYA